MAKISIEVTPCQYDVIKSFLELIEIRAREPTTNKRTQINAHSIKEHSNRSYKGVKIAIKNLNKKLNYLQ